MFLNSSTLIVIIAIHAITMIFTIGIFIYFRQKMADMIDAERKDYLNRLMSKDILEYQDIGVMPGKVKSSFTEKKRKTGTPFKDSL